MTKLADKIRIVSSDGEVVRDVVRDDDVVQDVETPDHSDVVTKKESLKDKLTGMLPSQSEDAGDEAEKESMMDKVSGMFAKDKDEEAEADGLTPQFPDLDDADEDDGGVPEDQRKWYIAGVVGLVILMVVSFVWYISSSRVDAVSVEPEEITSEEVSYILEGEPESFYSLVDKVGSDVYAEEDDGIAIDVPEEKEELEARVQELEDEVVILEQANEELTFENEKLESENKGLWDRVEQAEESLAESKETIKLLEKKVGDNK